MKAIVIAVAFAALTLASAQAATLHKYKSEASAQKHCPSDTVVWENTAKGVYHFKGSKYYGKTTTGRYVCQGEANAHHLKPASSNQ